MHGEIEYFSATSMFAAYQAGIEAVAPYVEAQDASGKWVRVMDDMGFPAGGPRTMTADLTDKLPQGTQRIRITTNLQIYSDNILVNRAAQDQDSRLTAVPLARADLRYHGFPLKVENQPPGNVLYVYEKNSSTGPYAHPAGTYTRYGDVRPLLAGYDDRLAVFGSGDEVALDFDPAKLQHCPMAGCEITSSWPTATKRIWISTPPRRTQFILCHFGVWERTRIPGAEPFRWMMRTSTIS